MAVLIAACVATAIIVYIPQPASEPYKLLTALCGRRDFTVVINTVGRLDAARSTVILSEIRGDRGKIIYLAKSGTSVKKGDVLIRFDPTPFEREVMELEAQVRQAEAEVEARDQLLKWEINQAESSVKTAEFDLRAAELEMLKLEKGDGPLELARLEGTAREAKQEYESKAGYLNELEALKDKGFATKSEIARARAAIDDLRRSYKTAMKMYETHRDFVLPFQIEQAKANVARAVMNLDQTRKASGFKIGQAKADLIQSKKKLESLAAALALSRNDLKKTTIRAPIPGMVVLRERLQDGRRIKPQVGDKVFQNQVLMYLPDISSMIVETRIREVDLHKVEEGTQAKIMVDAYPDLQLSGRVNSIGVLAESRPEMRGAEKYFQLVAIIEDGDPRLRPGMTARVVIQCSEVTDVLCVPMHAVFREEWASYVYVDLGGLYEKRQVTVGSQNEEWAEIREGLAEMERVALSLPPASEIHGQRDLVPDKK